MKERGKYFKTGLMIFLVICAAILFFFIVFKIDIIIKFILKVLKILSPIIIGAVIAYLLNPIVNGIESAMMSLFSHFKMGMRTRKKISKGIGIGTSMILFIAMVGVLLRFVIPELYDSILKLADNIKGYVNIIYEYISRLFENQPEIQERVTDMLTSFTSSVSNWFNVEILGGVQTVIGKMFSGIVSIAKSLINFLLGLCVAVYLLASKDSFIGQFKKIFYSRFKKENVNVLLAILRQVDSIFGGFISGKLLDSMIIGIICFIGVSIFRMPYSILLSVVIGVTNIIPIFGPWIGAIPCGLLVLIAAPDKALIFIIFIVALQQFDGNILGPNILGDSTGLSAFWVVLAITLGGGLFGVVGMLLGVPTFATIYFLIKTYTEFRLKQKNMPTQSVSYTRIKRIDPESSSAEFLDASLSKRERKKQRINEEEVNKEIEIAAKLSRKNREEKLVKKGQKSEPNEQTN